MRFISNLVRRTDYISRLLHDVDEQPRSASAAPTMGAGDEMHRSVSAIDLVSLHALNPLVRPPARDPPATRRRRRFPPKLSASPLPRPQSRPLTTRTFSPIVTPGRERVRRWLPVRRIRPAVRGQALLQGRQRTKGSGATHTAPRRPPRTKRVVRQPQRPLRRRRCRGAARGRGTRWCRGC